MKNFSTLFICLFFLTSFSFSQSDDKWEVWSDKMSVKAERLALKAERLAERVGADAERNAQDIAYAAERFAEGVERQFERGDYNVHLNGIPSSFKWNRGRSEAYLGIHSEHISIKKAEKLGFKNTYGSYVSKVVKNSAAEKAGLQMFDYIYGVEKQRTSDNQNLSDILDDFEPGDEVTLHLVRKGQQKTIKVTLGKYDDFDWQDQEEEQAFLGVKPADGEYSRDMDGVSIYTVSNSAAEDIGLENNDIIKEYNGYPVLDWDDLVTAIDNTKPDEKIELLIERDGQIMTKSGTVKAHANTVYSKTEKEGNNWNNWDWSDKESWSGSGAFLGVYIENISEKKANKLGFDNPYGSYVSGIIKNTAADIAGLMPFDYIYGIDEYRVGQQQNLGGILKKFEAGDEATVHFYRKGQKTSKDIIFRARSESEKVSKNKCEDPFLGISKIYDDSDDQGVRVKPVKNSTASKIGLESNDVITHINGYQMVDWMDIGIAIDMLSPGDKITVEYLRDGNKMTASGDINSYAEAKNCDDCDCDEHEKFSIDVDPDIHFEFSEGNKWIQLGSKSGEKNVSGMDVDMEDVSSSDARSLQGKGIEMSISNDLGVDELKMTPNPNMGMFDLEFNLQSEGNTMVRVFNFSGRVIYEYDLGRFVGDFSDYVDISQNGQGTYFLQISQDGKSFVRKIVLTKD